MIATNTTGGYTSINQIFNGMGYIGSTYWADKGVKGLIPNGRNEDGSLKNTELVNSTLRVATLTNYTNSNLPVQISSGGTGWSDWLYIQEEKPNDNYSHWYQPSTNILYYAGATVGDYNKVNHLIYGFIDRTIGVITGWRPNLPFRAVDYNEFVNTPRITETYVNGTSWYRVYSDGWIEQGGQIDCAKNASVTVTFLKAYTNTNYNVTGMSHFFNADKYDVGPTLTDRTTTTMNLGNMWDSTVTFQWRTAGY